MQNAENAAAADAGAARLDIHRPVAEVPHCELYLYDNRRYRLATFSLVRYDHLGHPRTSYFAINRTGASAARAESAARLLLSRMPEERPLVVFAKGGGGPDRGQSREMIRVQKAIAASRNDRARWVQLSKPTPAYYQHARLLTRRGGAATSRPISSACER